MEKLFNYKRFYNNINGDEMLNMSIPSLDITKIKSNSALRLNQSHNGRLDKFVYDLVSKDIDSGLDLTMYYNHIFNPFAVKEDDVIFTPIIDDSVFQKQLEPELPDGTKLSDKMSNQKSMTYAEKVEYYAKLGLGIK